MQAPFDPLAFLKMRIQAPAQVAAARDKAPQFETPKMETRKPGVSRLQSAVETMGEIECHDMGNEFPHIEQ